VTVIGSPAQGKLGAMGKDAIGKFPPVFTVTLAEAGGRVVPVEACRPSGVLCRRERDTW